MYQCYLSTGGSQTGCSRILAKVLWCETGRRQHRLPTIAVSINGGPVTLIKWVWSLGTLDDADLVMDLNVLTRIVNSGSSALPLLKRRYFYSSGSAATFDRKEQ